MIKKLFKRMFSKPATLGREAPKPAAHLNMGESRKVKASELATDGNSIHEWGWHPNK